MPAGAVGSAGLVGLAVPAGAAGVASSQIVSNATTSVAGLANNSLTTVTVSCPVGKTLLSGGGQVTTTASQSSRAILASSYPSGAAQWTAVGVTNAALGAGNTMTVTAYAVCTA